MITVDNKEPWSTFQDIKKILPDTLWKSLYAGDYDISTEYALVLVTRKTTEDLANSITNGHLNDEARKMVEILNLSKKQIKVAILEIEGWMSATIDGSFRTKSRVWPQKWSYVWNYLLGLQLHGFLIDYSPNQHFTVDRLVKLHDYFSKPESEHDSLRAVSMPAGYSDQLKILCCIPGYDIILGKRMGEKFGTLRNIFSVPWQKRVEVDGIGQVKAQIIDSILDKEIKEEWN